MFRDSDKHQTNRSRADDEHALTGAQFQILDALHDARERLGQRGVAKAYLRFEPEQIFFNQSRGHHNGFGVSAIQKQQVVAEVFLAALTEETVAAGSRVGGDDAIADAPIPISGFRLGNSDFAYDSCVFVSTDGRRYGHITVLSALPYL